LSTLRVFDQQRYDHLNRARAEVVSRLLAELRVSLGLKTAVDVGCGLGYFSGFLKSLGLDVTAIDGRQQNVEEAQRRNPDIRFLRFDAEDPAIRSLGKFDLVFCFGLLYHLENPFLAIRNLHAMTGKLLLGEGVIFPGDAPTMGLVDEFALDDQGLNHIAFYPTEACLQKMSYCAGFRFVYRLTTPPDHVDYHRRGSTPKVRTMLAASHQLISSPQLEVAPHPSMPIYPWDAQSVAAYTSSVETLRGFSQRPLSEKLRILGHIIRRKVSAQRRAGR
jgi:SAM-dependent methyltransferase